MGIRFQGDITIDVADYDGDVEVSIDDASDISDLMYQNSITIEEVMEYQDVSKAWNYSEAVEWLTECADGNDLINVIDVATRQIRSIMQEEAEARQTLFKEINDLKLSKSELVKAIRQFDSTSPDDS